MNDLFGQPITDPQPVHHHGHAAKPGTGPAGATCGTCRHRATVKIRSRRRFQKCILIRKNWTNGPGTDIRCKDAACQFFEKKDEQ